MKIYPLTQKLERLALIRGEDKCLASIREQTLASLQAQKGIELAEATQRLDSWLATVPQPIPGMLVLWSEAELDTLTAWIDRELARLEDLIDGGRFGVEFTAAPVVCRPRPGLVPPQVEPQGNCIHYYGRIEFGLKLCCVPNPDGPGLFAVDCPYKETIE